LLDDAYAEGGVDAVDPAAVDELDAKTAKRSDRESDACLLPTNAGRPILQMMRDQTLDGRARSSRPLGVFVSTV